MKNLTREQIKMEDELAVERIKKREEEEDYIEKNNSFFVYITEEQIREIVRDELLKLDKK